jgi:hypothetical protein
VVDTITYRTNDATRWGTGKGSDVAPPEVDINFFLLYTMIMAQRAATDGIATFDYMEVVGDQLFMHMSNHHVFGPYTLPTAQWNFKGQWQPFTLYSAMDVVSDNGACYLVTWPHTSAATFDAMATDGFHYYYGLLIDQPVNVIPTDGLPGQRLTKSGDSPERYAWEWDKRIIGPIYVRDVPMPSEVVFGYICTENLTLPSGLSGSGADSVLPGVEAENYNIEKNGTVIGHIHFPASGAASAVFASAVELSPGDRITVHAPASPDPHRIGVMITLSALVEA